MFFREIKQSDGEDMYSVGNDSSYGIQDLANISLSFENRDQKRYLLKFTPSFVYDNSRVNTDKESMVFTMEETMNESESKTIHPIGIYLRQARWMGGLRISPKRGAPLWPNSNMVLMMPMGRDGISLWMTRCRIKSEGIRLR